MLWNSLLNFLFSFDEKTTIVNRIVNAIETLPYSIHTAQKPYPSFSFFSYETHTTRTLIWQLKYKGNKKVASFFAQRMYDLLCEELSDFELYNNFKDPLLIPIPISKKRKWLRGYNQTELLAKELENIDQSKNFNYLKNVLYKIKDTKSQARLKDKKERQKNLKDSFTVKDISRIKNRNIILLDDVLTTGSTLTEASRVLREAGVRKIIWVTVAH